MGGARKILFATSNGTGLGHLNRAMAIARRLPEDVEPLIFTLSQAAPVVAEAGFRVEYHPSYRRPGSGSDWQWNMRLRARLESLLAEEAPDLVVFDGVHPYRALTHVLTASGAPPAVWCRRSLWHRESSPAALRRTGAFDAVLEPGELAADLDVGPTVARRGEAMVVDPILYLDEGELLGRPQAARALGLDPERRTALVNLGQGGATDSAVARTLARLEAEPDLQVAVLESSVGAGIEVPEGVVALRSTFPMSRYFRAFDLAVAAAGYNAFHELVAFGVPTLFVPMPRRTDDQAARARWAAAAGVGCAVAGPEAPDLESELDALLDERERERLADACREELVGNGAAEAAGRLAAMAFGKPPIRAVRRRSPITRWLRHSSHRIGPMLPVALGLTARDLRAHPERRRPQALIYALGVPDDELGPALERELASLEVPAGRVLVLTDSLQLRLLRELGVGFARVPAAAELGLRPEEASYREALERRVAVATGRWRRSVPTRWLGASRARLGVEGEEPVGA